MYLHSSGFFNVNVIGRKTVIGRADHLEGEGLLDLQGGRKGKREGGREDEAHA